MIDGAGRRGTARGILCSITGGTSMTEMVIRRATYNRIVSSRIGKTSMTAVVAEKGIWRRILYSRREAASINTRDFGLFSRRRFGWSEPDVHPRLAEEMRHNGSSQHRTDRRDKEYPPSGSKRGGDAMVERARLSIWVTAFVLLLPLVAQSSGVRLDENNTYVESRLFTSNTER